MGAVKRGMRYGGGWKKRASNFGVELGPAEDAERDDVEPEEQSDAGAEGAVDPGVVGKTGDVPAEGEGGEEPHDGGDDGSGKECASRAAAWGVPMW